MTDGFDQISKFLPIAIVGMGITGEAAFEMLLTAGVSRDQIKTFDEKKPADFFDPEKLLSQFKPRSLLISPGIPLSKSWIQDFKKNGGLITSELEMATFFLGSEKVISITGSIGKSTTTAVLGAGAHEADQNVFMGGNFGIPLASYVTKILKGAPKAKYVILELSSFQLENFSNLKSDISLITFLSANHLERYKDLEDYFETKISLLEKTKTEAILNLNGGDIAKMQDSLPERFPHLHFSFIDRDFFKARELRSPKMIGEHNLDNLALAYAVGKKLGWQKKSFEAMLNFPGLSHRLENCGVHQGILFLNDSKSTAIDSVLEAANAVSGKKVHFLLGGRDKNLPWENLSILKNLGFHFHFFGEYGKQAQIKSNLPGEFSKDLKTCLKNLKSQLLSGETVLLSPGGTSLDEFKGFEDRGNFFKAWVKSEFND